MADLLQQANNLKQKISNIPRKPGVYIYKDTSGVVLYVGKAINLKSRVAQYFNNSDKRPQIPFLLNDIADLEYIVVDNEVESLLLENTLIKKYLPKYNIQLRDDKNYSFITIDSAFQIPQIYTVRNPESKNARYFGPYSSGYKIRETLNILRKIFPYCANKEIGARPCFYYYLHRCPGVCIGKVSLAEYQEQTIKKIALFLAGNISEIKKEISAQMETAARSTQYEKAAGLRDQLFSLSIIEERQKTIFPQKVNWDFISCFQTADKTTVNVLAIRSGHLNDSKNFILENTASRTDSEIIGAFMEKYYLGAASAGAQDGAIAQNADLPKKIFVETLPEGIELFKKIFEDKNHSRCAQILVPRKGKKAGLIALGKKNAREFFETWTLSQATEVSRTALAVGELAKVLKLEKVPDRIECFDISNIQGTNSVASMVVFEHAKPKKSDYRKFKIKTDGVPNDFAMMREALTRRFDPVHWAKPSTDAQPVAANGGERDNSAVAAKKWPLPDLLVIDGGKGQLGIAVEVLASYGLNIPVIGLAKREEEIFVPGESSPILLPKSDYALQLLQRIRDEAHRFGITFHKQLRSKSAYKSALDDITGIGPKKKKLLIKTYGSVAGIKKAARENLPELARLVGAKAAENIVKS